MKIQEPACGAEVERIRALFADEEKMCVHVAYKCLHQSRDQKRQGRR